MLPLSPFPPHAGPLRILCLGAHSDDIEIGCGGTILSWNSGNVAHEFTWVVLSAGGERESEASAGASRFLQGAGRTRVVVKDFRNGYFPWVGDRIKDYFEEPKAEISPDVILTHYRSDRHQDHRLVSDLTWNTFRDHLILEYEVPKYDGDFGSPNLFAPLDESLCREKVRILLSTFRSQSVRKWFTEETFMALMRLRGIEASAPGGYAEAFYARKVLLASPGSLRP